MSKLNTYQALPVSVEPCPTLSLYVHPCKRQMARPGFGVVGSQNRYSGGFERHRATAETIQNNGATTSRREKCFVVSRS